MGIDNELCAIQVEQSNTERERDKIKADRKVHKLGLQLLQLQESTGIEAAALKAQVRELEQEKKDDAKARTVFLSSKADLEEQLKVSRGEQARLDLRKEAIRLDRVKLNKLLINGHKRIKEAVVKQTLTVETTERVFFDCVPVLCSFYVALVFDSLISLLVRLCNNGLQSLNMQRD
jgi:hypothetical protein